MCERTSWEGGYIGVNSFGFGGSNVHVLLRSPDTTAPADTSHAATMAARLVTCAGRTKEGVEATLAEALRHPTDVEMQCLLESSVGDLSPITHPYRGAALVNTATSRQTVEVSAQPHSILSFCSGDVPDSKFFKSGRSRNEMDLHIQIEPDSVSYLVHRNSNQFHSLIVRHNSRHYVVFTFYGSRESFPVQKHCLHQCDYLTKLFRRLHV